MSRGPDGRFVTDTGQRAGYHDPVPVTCASCGQPTAGEIHLKGGGYVADPLDIYCASCGTPPGRGFGVTYDRTPDRRENCRWCGRLFRCDSPLRLYCTDPCRQRGAMAKRDQRRRIDQVRHQRRCATCGEPFTAPRQDACYCSPACRQRAYRQRLADQAAERAYAVRMLTEYEAQLGA